MARASRLGGAGVADEDQLRVEAQRPEREAALQMRDAHGAHTDLGALGPGERRHAIGRRAGSRIDCDRRPAGVVAVEAQAGIDVELRAAPRPEYGTALRADPA